MFAFSHRFAWSIEWWQDLCLVFVSIRIITRRTIVIFVNTVLLNVHFIYFLFFDFDLLKFFTTIWQRFTNFLSILIWNCGRFSWSNRFRSVSLSWFLMWATSANHLIKQKRFMIIFRFWTFLINVRNLLDNFRLFCWNILWKISFKTLQLTI